MTKQQQREEANKEYSAIVDPARKEYNASLRRALQEYEAIVDQAYEAYQARLAEIGEDDIPDTITKNGVTYKRV